jgi:fucose 4-O-acetylase-like acetyltransferase
MAPSMTPRNEIVDISKGIGIIFVVLGHSWIVREKGELFRVIFSFHMPLFLFLAGVFLNEEAGVKRLVKTKADTLLKPYFSTLIGFGILKAIIAAVTREGGSFDLIGYLEGVVYGTGETIVWGALWFLPHLFLTSVISAFLVKAIKNRTRYPVRWMEASVALLLSVGVYGISFFWDPLTAPNKSHSGVGGLPGLPWSVDLIPISSAFFISGYLLRKEVKALTFNAVGLILSAAVFSLCHYIYDETIDLNLRIYGEPFVSTTQAVLGVYMTLGIAAFGVKFKPIAQPLAYIGSGSLFVLMFHMFIQGKAFDILFKINSSLVVNSVVGVFLGVFLPLCFWEFAKRCKMVSLLFLPDK